MLRKFSLFASFLFLTGCAVELAAVAVGLVTAPIWIPVQHVYAKERIVQPIAVKDRRGRVITPDYGVAPAATFQISKETVTCTGVHDIVGSAERIAMACDKKLKGRAHFSKFTVASVSLNLGLASIPERRIGYLATTLFSCKGNYDRQSGFVAAFLIDCGDNGKAAIVEVTMKDGRQGFKVWINPPT